MALSSASASSSTTTLPRPNPGRSQSSTNPGLDMYHTGDSQHDMSTAVNTPMVMTPLPSQPDLAGMAGTAMPDDTLEPHRHGRGYRSDLSSYTDISNKTNTHLSENHAQYEDEERTLSQTLGHTLRSIKTRPERAVEQEAALHEHVQLRGVLSHQGEKGMRGGVVERREMIDFGKGRGLEEVIVVDWLPDDPDNPFNWPNKKKYILLYTAVLTTALTALNCTSVAILSAAGAPAHFGVSRQEFVLNVTLLVFAISNTPLVLAPISEVLGRNMIYQVTSVITMVLFLPQALSTNYSAILAVRWFQGMSSSVGNSMVGGTVADLFRADDRGRAMNIFSLVIFFGQSFGGVLFGWIAMNLGIPWAYWIQLILGGVSCILNLFFLRETRADVILSRRAKRLTKQTGKRHLCVADMQRQSMWTLMSVSVVRPLQYLVTEPIVTALSAWIGFAWACVFLGGTSILLVFQQYGWNYGQLGSIQIVVALGGLLGWATSHHQEHLYHLAALKAGGKAPPEARLYYAAYGGLAFPLAMYAFAWTGRPEIPWPVPAVFLIIANWGIFCMYSGVFNYIADAYETYSSSAQAAQSWARNMASGIFPLFAFQMYTRLGYPIASTVVASVALVLAAAPLLLLRYGKALRARSRVASALESEAMKG